MLAYSEYFPWSFVLELVHECAVAAGCVFFALMSTFMLFPWM
jgi:hypothetical protein